MTRTEAVARAYEITEHLIRQYLASGGSNEGMTENDIPVDNYLTDLQCQCALYARNLRAGLAASKMP